MQVMTASITKTDRNSENHTERTRIDLTGHMTQNVGKTRWKRLDKKLGDNA